MRIPMNRVLVATAALSVTAMAPAQAHTLGGGGGFAAGLVHPFLGLDHLLAMLAVGLWAAQQRGLLRVAAPAVFVAAMALGAMAAVSGVGLSGTEGGIAASVLVLGLLVAGRARLSLPVGLALVAGCAAFHGYAHGMELPPAASVGLYALGMVLATLALHAAGFLVGDHLQRSLKEAWLRASGGAIVATGALAWMAG